MNDMNDKERVLLLEALSGHAAHVRGCIDACERAVPGLPPTKPGVLAAYREELTMLDRLYAKIQAEGCAPSDSATPERPESNMRRTDIERLAKALRGQVGKFSDSRLNDYDHSWRDPEIEYRRSIAETANAVCVALQLDAATFATACGLYVSDGRDSYSDCRPGELTWEMPRGDAA